MTRAEEREREQKDGPPPESNKREWGGQLLPGTGGSVVSAPDFQTLILSSILVEVSLSLSLHCHYIMLWKYLLEASPHELVNAR